jgi:hypothetical protein
MSHTQVGAMGGSYRFDPFKARRIFFIAIVSPVRAGPRLSAKSGTASLRSTGAGAIDGAVVSGASGSDAAGGGGALARGAAPPVPGCAGTDPANAGPGVIRTRAGSLVTRGGAVAAAGAEGTCAEGFSADVSDSAGSVTTSGAVPSDEPAEAEGVAVKAKCAANTSAAATPTRRSGRPPAR